MIDDPIVKEVREARRKILESHAGDVEKHAAAVIAEQKKFGKRLVSLEPNKVEPTTSANTKR